MHIPSRLIWKTWLTLGLALGLTLVSGCGQQAKTAPPPSSTAPQGQALWTGGGGAGGLYLLGFNPASRAASGTPKPDDFLIGLQDPLFAIRGQSLDVIWGAEGGSTRWAPEDSSSPPPSPYLCQPRATSPAQLWILRATSGWGAGTLVPGAPSRSSLPPRSSRVEASNRAKR